MDSFYRERLAYSTEVVLSVSLVFLLLLAGLRQGLKPIVFDASVAFISFNIGFIEALSSVLGFSLFILVCTMLSLSQIFLQSRSIKAGETDRSIVAVIPTYKDSHALERSVPSLIDLDPDLEVMIVCEEDDSEAIEMSKDMSERFGAVDYTVNDLSPGTKAGAVNCGIAKTDSEAVFVFDADQEVKSGFIGKSMELLFNRSYDVVQARVVPRPEGFLEALCYCEALFMYVIPERLADFLTDYKVAGSRGTAMRRETFERMEGYDPDFLTEDMDFAFRCYEKGLNVKPLLSEVCTEEAPHSLKDYWGQRKRWVKGHIEVFVSRARYLWDEPSIKYLKSAAISGFIPFGWFFLIILISKFLILLLLGQEFLVTAALSLLIGISLIFRFIDRKHLKKDGYRSYINLIGAPLVFPLYGLVAIKSLFEFFIGRDSSWYMVEKTA